MTALPPYDLITLGETMLRLSVSPGNRLDVAHQLDVCPGGAESNVAAALSRLGRRCAWVSSLPTNPLGHLVANHLRMAGVDLSGVLWEAAGRLGTYYVELAVPPRPSQVIYDRAHSCFSKLGPDQIDWPFVLQSRLLHLTGITPALSPDCRALATRAVTEAKAAGVAVSFDVNYRQRLWSESEAREVLTPLIQGADLVFCGRVDAARVFGCEGEPEEIARHLGVISGARSVVITLEAEGAIAWDGDKFWHERAQPVQIVDRLGAGDALAAGVIHGWLDGDLFKGLRCGVVLAAMALSQKGDMVVTTEEELESLLRDANGALVR